MAQVGSPGKTKHPNVPMVWETADLITTIFKTTANIGGAVVYLQPPTNKTNQGNAKTMPESTFDPQTFLNVEVEGEMEVRYTPVPEGDYISTIDEIAVREVQGGSIVLDVTHLIHDEALAEKMGMDRLTVRQGIFLDIEPDGRIALGPNKNVRLGRLREAVGQNAPGPWNFQMLKGAGPLKIAVSISPDKEDETIKYNRVDRTLPNA